MKVAIPKEIREHETRVAASPAMVKKLVEMGVEVAVETGAGASAATPDAAFAEAGAKITDLTISGDWAAFSAVPRPG